MKHLKTAQYRTFCKLYYCSKKINLNLLFPLLKGIRGASHAQAKRKTIHTVLAHLSLTPEGKNIFNLQTVCRLSGLQIETSRNRGALRKCDRCQLYGHSQRFCNARPRCVKILDDYATADCSVVMLTVEPPPCVLCGLQGYTANYRRCLKAPHFKCISTRAC